MSDDGRDLDGRFGPENPYRFSPGQTGNPRGRPKGASFAAPLARHALSPVADREEMAKIARTIGLDPEQARNIDVVSGLFLRGAACLPFVARTAAAIARSTLGRYDRSHCSRFARPGGGARRTVEKEEAMKIDLEQRADVTILHLAGDLVADEADRLLEAAEQAMSARGARLVLDLAKMAYLSSAGISALVRITAQANTQEQSVALACPQPLIGEIFATTKLDRFFTIYPTVDAALAEGRT